MSQTYTSKGIPFITAKNVQNEDVIFENLKFISKNDAEMFLRKCNPQINDILLVSRGATIGRVCHIQTEEQFCLLGSVILIKLNQKIDPIFLLNYLRSENTQKFFKIFDSTAQDALYIKDITNMLITLPLLPEQKQIGSILSNIDEQITQQQSHLNNLKVLRKSILNSKLTKEKYN